MTNREAELEARLAEHQAQMRKDFPLQPCRGCAELQAKFAALQSQVERLREALEQFATVQLDESNCASFDVANRRIRAIARAALASSPQTEKCEFDTDGDGNCPIHTNCSTRERRHA